MRSEGWQSCLDTITEHPESHIISWYASQFPMACRESKKIGQFLYLAAKKDRANQRQAWANYIFGQELYTFHVTFQVTFQATCDGFKLKSREDRGKEEYEVFLQRCLPPILVPFCLSDAFP